MAQPLNTTNFNSDGTVAGGSLDFATIIPQILEKFLLVLEGAAIIAAGYFMIQIIRSKLRKIEISHEPQRNAINLLEKITTGFIIVISITLALKVVGIDMTLLVSVSILGLSYGLQDVIKNYVAGILILFKSPFKIGEIVKIRNFTGRVSKMDFQSTTLETFDHRYITIYNSDVMTQSIINYTATGSDPAGNLRRIDIDFMLGYGSDVDKALSIFEKILKAQTSIMKTPRHSIIFKKFAEGSIVFTLKFWVQKPCNILKTRSQIALLMHQAFDEEKIFMPYTKDIQANSDYSQTPERKQRFQNFSAQPLFAEIAAAGAGAEAGSLAEIEAESAANQIDFEEPEAENEA